MIEGTLSRRYAKALFALARDEKTEENVAADLDRFVNAHDGSDLGQVLSNPAFSLEKRRSVALQVAEALGLSSVVTRFLALLIERDRCSILASTARQYHRLLDDAMGRVQARVVSPVPLGNDKKKDLHRVLKQICKKEVILNEETRPELIGGLMIEIEGKVYDGTVTGQLQRMRDEIEQG